MYSICVCVCLRTKSGLFFFKNRSFKSGRIEVRFPIVPPPDVIHFFGNELVAVFQRHHAEASYSVQRVGQRYQIYRAALLRKLGGLGPPGRRTNTTQSGVIDRAILRCLREYRSKTNVCPSKEATKIFASVVASF